MPELLLKELCPQGGAAAQVQECVVPPGALQGRVYCQAQMTTNENYHFFGCSKIIGNWTRNTAFAF